ncbi:hypothetical protein SanaruYs_31300 [Chryseotalea sanaruensis]|uniref:Response regulator n=1 Tax=Chryseotalea sanaruensis TaxID=2482724 RepID=A0A401UDE2_9BACT|nr:hypothetical protein [Chryseotalea sanaruensis]GCC52890.1 hypothetical protein SanaruYs_31300 [Chryseotalea sanaruensis]
MKYKIGYIDENSLEVAKYEKDLRAYFDVIGYDIKKGLPLLDLINQVYQSDIDLLMIDYLLVDKGVLTYNGDEVARTFEEIKPRFPMIIFTHEQSQALPHVDNPFIICDKAEVKDNAGKFASKLTKLIEQYKTYISKRKNLINELLDKGESEGLKADEKHELLDAQLELNNLDKRSTEVPLQLLTDKKLEDLSKTTKEAEAFLESLIKKSKKK